MHNMYIFLRKQSSGDEGFRFLKQSIMLIGIALNLPSPGVMVSTVTPMVFSKSYLQLYQQELMQYNTKFRLK